MSDHDSHIIALHRQGINRDAIRERLGVSKDYVGQVLRKHGLSSPTGPRPKWSPERKAFAAEKWEAGMNASDIAERLGGITRNAVLGMLFRMGVKRPEGLNETNRRKNGSDHGGYKGPKARRPRKTKPALAVVSSTAKTHAEPPKPKAIRSGPSPLANPKPWTERLDGECTWPVAGDVAETISCCAPIVRGTSWCDHHNGIGRTQWGGKGYSARPEAFADYIVRRCA